MLGRLRSAVLPPSQRRTLEELTEELDLRAGDSARRSAFWTMLVLSAVIATAGVLADSTATVIGAMIIAPLSTPIMGIALGIVKRRRTGATRYVLAGAALVIAIGWLFTAVLPGSYDLLSNSQIASRTSPGMLDAVAAMATGFAGSVALARRDVGAVLPGVAIAISLVPPLAVVGVCLGEGSPQLAFGALALFLSNLVALVLTGVLVFAVLVFSAVDLRAAGRPARRAYLALITMLVLVLLPLAANTAGALLLSYWEGKVESVAESWLSPVPAATVTGVDFVSNTFVVNVETPGSLPPVPDLLTALSDELPGGIPVKLKTTIGETVVVGTTT